MISIVIATLNEADTLGLLLESLSKSPVEHEVIQVDGGSDDASVAIGRKHGVNVLSSLPGRGPQLALGADHAQGDVVLFLHADSQFPADGLQKLEQWLHAYPAAIGGNFKLRFDGQDPFSLWLNRFYARLRRRGVYYGDSCIFIRTQALQRIGGIRPLLLMEDYDLVRRMRATGQPRLYVNDTEVLTSSRRFHGRKKWRIVSGWVLIHLLFHLGLPSRFLAYLYDSQRRGKQLL